MFEFADIVKSYVSVYDVLTGKIEKIISGHKGNVRDASWHPHRPEIVSTSVSIGFQSRILQTKYVVEVNSVLQV